ncbi:MAG: hypothetical protein CSA62_00300 [Planctomycetota bacterium]|nr:MAG: hypothetical protein CSA62_00300 [Planctomycetota bacterium]
MNSRLMYSEPQAELPAALVAELDFGEALVRRASELGGASPAESLQSLLGLLHRPGRPWLGGAIGPEERRF